MNKISAIATIIFLSATLLQAKKPSTADQIALLKAQNATLKVELAEKDSIINNIPDTLCVTALDSTFCVPTKDAQDVAIPIVDYIKQTNSDGWPKTGKGWLAWLLALVPLVFSAKKLTAINNVWAILKPYLKTRLGLAILFGGLLSTVATLVVSWVSKSDFSFSMLMVVWPWASLGASYLHNIKKKDAVQA